MTQVGPRQGPYKGEAGVSGSDAEIGRCHTAGSEKKGTQPSKAGSREEKGGKRRGKETSMYGCLLRVPYWGPGLQPRHVP